ncbi:MAG: peptidylprolyl isomerase [Acidobacteriaceae bacterium]|jgi:cyclophilin family peptidyl-prolyl cis-trans isomerase|nr:peptidylprolyl isomerase [Acidobacteriaceae bacterium]
MIAISRRTPGIVVLAVALTAWAADASAQASRLPIVQAMERGVTSVTDLGTLRVDARSANGDMARLALRALGQLEQSVLITDLLPALTHALPEVRLEAAHAVAQAAVGFPATPARGATLTVQSTQAALITRLGVETDSSVRAGLREAIARLPYRDAADVARAETAILSQAATPDLNDRLGTARALEILVRRLSDVRPASETMIAALHDLAKTPSDAQEAAHDARVRRLAIDALAEAHDPDPSLIDIAHSDPDAQTRRLAIRAIAANGGHAEQIEYALTDPAPMVRLEALTSLGLHGGQSGCRVSVEATFDEELLVALTAIDQLAACGEIPEAMQILERSVADDSDLDEPRGFHRATHALVALAAARPADASDAITRYAQKTAWQVRLAAANAAIRTHDRTTLLALAEDRDDRVSNAARTALGDTPKAPTPPPLPPISAADLRTYASPRAKITIRDVGSFEIALFTSEAPLTVLRFIALAETHYYDGTAVDALVPNLTLRAGYRGVDADRYPRREVSGWPHVRGTLGIATPDTLDASFFLNLVDNPQFDHQYTVFAQVLNGIEIVDRLLDGDIIESIEILP